ncbi:hypothetical protein A9X01_14240 [Mycobacterium asiaticum]|uniref:Uncharacterized protein n=1 Tax=Mycobacterium asiaticum TaxID=1790 RepID=A0A1A3CQG1_MYCAS|nr:hypothetical protein A9X01_14240 [Mycobacterium asiaticum]
MVPIEVSRRTSIASTHPHDRTLVCVPTLLYINYLSLERRIFVIRRMAKSEKRSSELQVAVCAGVASMPCMRSGVTHNEVRL